MEIVPFGHHSLSRSANPVKFPINDTILNFIKKMEAYFVRHSWAGLAAPQLALDLRIFMFRAPKERIGQDEIPVPLTTVINPIILLKSYEVQLGWESCLSYPSIDGEVPRNQKIEYSFYTVTGELIKSKASGFHARVFQHEYDHLDGIVFPQRMGLENRFRDHGTKKELIVDEVWAILNKDGIKKLPDK